MLGHAMYDRGDEITIEHAQDIEGMKDESSQQQRAQL
jgi:hypothetical protein